MGWIFQVSRIHMSTEIGFPAAARLKWVRKSLETFFSLSQNNLWYHISSAKIVSERQKKEENWEGYEKGKIRHGKALRSIKHSEIRFCFCMFCIMHLKINIP